MAMANGLLAAYIGGPAAQVGWLGPQVGGHLAPFLYSSCEPSELSQYTSLFRQTAAEKNNKSQKQKANSN